MKKLILLFLMSGAFALVKSQAEISYILPDIGAPGMNTYMEIIAPHDQTGNFGEDAMYINGVDVDGNSTDEVEFVLVNSDDEDKIIFGPAIVSWDGRMISTQVFVNPYLNPNTSDWENLDNEFKVEFYVSVNGSTPIDNQTFYILQPTQLGDISGSAETVFGEGNLGKRSPSGAMIVDSLILADNTKYTVSVNDPDPSRDGNQAYLPFILLSKGAIRGGTNTEISLSADDYGNDRDAAPGGGGGGGRFCDEVSGNNGADGGNGFTGGGEGGWNRYLEGGNIGGWKDPGIGTGDIDGISLNGVAGGITPVGSAAESSGGGTGHPFGTSGEGATFNTDEGRSGGYGAGSGRQRDWAGGGAGYGTDGEQVGPLNIHGKVHGNVMTVPIAGGSGGASGNPEADFFPDSYCSGSGGGGGGALQIFAPVIENLDLTAIGGQGGGGHDGSNGGSGSGGYVGIFSKIVLNNTYVNVSGNQRGTTTGKRGKSGEGRLRYDAASVSNLSQETTFNSVFEGLTSDTSYYVKRNHIIRGTKDPNETISYYLKSLNTDWQMIATNSANAIQWNQTLDLQDEDMYFFFAVQHNQTPNSGTYDDEPNYVLSQAAANVLLIEKDPDISGETIVYDTITNCEGKVITVPFWVWNEGEGPLELNMQNAIFYNSNNNGFSLNSPTTVQTLAGTPVGNTDYDSLQISINVEYNPFLYSQPLSGVIRDTILIPNNDPDENPWIVAFEIFIEEYSVSSHLIQEDPLFQNPIDSLYLGKVCRGGSASRDFIIYNRSPFQVSINAPYLVKDNVGFEAILNFSMPLDSDDGSSATVYFDDVSINEDIVWDIIYIMPNDCPGKVVDSLVVWADIVDTDIQALAPTSFDDTRIGNTSSKSVVFENTGTADLLLESLADITVNPPFYVTGATPNPPTVIKPGEQITVDVDFSPTDINNPKIQFLNLEFAASDTTCPDDLSHELQGLAIQSELEINKMVLDFGTLRHCQTALDTVSLNVSGNINITITDSTEISGNDKDNFEITNPGKTYPLVIDDAGVKYFIKYNPISAGTHNAEIVIKTDDPENPEIIIRLTGTMEPFNVTATQSPFDIGDVPVGFDVPFTVSIDNNGYFEEFFVEILNPSGIDYTLDNSMDNTLIQPGGDIDITGILNLTQSGIYNETLTAAFEYPTDEGSICYDTVYINIRANGLNASLEITDEIDLGVVTPCNTDALDIIEFRHSPTSKAPYVILNEELTNDASGLFSISSSGLNVPDTLDTEANLFAAQIYFNPNGAADGVYTCNYHAEYYINGQFKDTLITVKAEVVSAEFGFAANPLDMGTVILGTPPVQGAFTLTNTGIWDITITDMTPITNVGIFTITPDPIGIQLAPGESQSFDVTFSPDQNIEYTEQLTFEFTYSDDSCIETGIMNIRGEGGVTKKVELSIPDLFTTPDLDNFHIPIYGKLINEGEPELLTGFSIDTIEISYNRTLFYPREVTNGTIIANYIDNNTRVIQLEIPNISISDSTVITEIIGYTMLGNTVSTPIDILYASHSQPELVSDLLYLDGSGSLNIEICEEGGDRLLQILEPDTPIAVSPNPADNNITISMNLIEKGLHRLELIDINGKSIEIDKWYRLNSGYYELDYNTSELSSGMYYLILKSPNRSYSLPVFIVK